MSEVEGEVEQDQDQDQELSDGFKEALLTQFATADGSTIVLSADDMNSMGLGQVDDMEEVADSHDQFVEQIIGGDEVGEEGEMGEIHVDADGNHHLVTNSMQDLITLHAVDSQGNIITEGDDTQHIEEDPDDALTQHIALAEGDMESLMEGEQMVEEVIAEGGEEADEGIFATETMEVGGDEQQQYMNVQEAIFNPTTGTLQPLSQPTSNVQATQPIQPKPAKKVVTKYIIAQQPSGEMGSQGGQQIVLDAQALQGLIQGGNISLSGSPGKQNIFLSSPSKPKPPVVKSPAKILPAPVPIGDQQQSGTRLLLKQGNVLTPINHLPQGGKLLQVPGTSGNQIQYVRVVQNKSIAPSNKIPIAPVTSKPKPVAPKPAPGQTIFTLPAGTSAADFASLQNQGLGNFVVVPNFMVKGEPGTPVPIRPADSHSMGSPMLSESLLNSLGGGMGGGGNTFDSFRSLLEPNGMRPRKPCNCTKSQCLKLYCDCFANGEFCHLCNCTNCFNNLNHEEDRQKAIKLVLERNPGAFRPKIGKSSQSGEAHERRHNKGCNCRRSGCLKNYCECYEAKIFCSGICKCTGCKNCIENIPSGLPNGVGVEQHFAGAGTSHRQTLKDLAEAAEVRVQQQNQVKNKMRAQMQDVSPQNNLGIMVPPLVFRYPQGSISYEVVTSTVELLLARAESSEKQKLPEGEIERLVMEEFGDCLSAVMELGNTVEKDTELV